MAPPPSTSQGDSKLTTFPSECPQPHKAREWLQRLGEKITELKLQQAARGEVPLRVSHLRNWPPHLTAVPDDVAESMDAASLYKARADAARRARDNEENDQAIKVAVIEDKNALATLITETMVDTAPLLREELRTQAKSGENYDGKVVRDALLKYLATLGKEGIDEDYYTTAEAGMRDPKTRLPAGCTPSTASTGCCVRLARQRYWAVLGRSYGISGRFSLVVVCLGAF